VPFSAVEIKQFNLPGCQRLMAIRENKSCIHKTLYVFFLAWKIN
jgi:hypothetical protein